MSRSRSRTSAVPLLVLAFVALASCTKDKAAPAERAIREFPVRTLHPQEATVHKAYPATLEGIQTIALRPRVAGYIESIAVDEGAQVAKGQVLFTINSDEFEQGVASARANVEVAKAAVETARLEVENKRPLVERKIVSAYTLQAAEQSLQSAKAKHVQARAELRNSQTNLDYSVVKSPTNGVIGTIPYRIGSLVGSESAEPLTYISDIHKVRAYFSVNEKDYLTYFRASLEAQDDSDQAGSGQRVSLVLADGRQYPHQGKIDAVSGLVDQATGTLTVRATFDNPDRLLRSGSSATLRLPTTMDEALVVPQAATFEVQDKRMIYVVDADNKVKAQPIKVVPSDDGKNFILQSGLQAGQSIVTEGISSLSDGVSIKPVEASKTEPVGDAAVIDSADATTASKPVPK